MPLNISSLASNLNPTILGKGLAGSALTSQQNPSTPVMQQNVTNPNAGGNPLLGSTTPSVNSGSYTNNPAKSLVGSYTGYVAPINVSSFTPQQQGLVQQALSLANPGQQAQVIGATPPTSVPAPTSTPVSSSYTGVNANGQSNAQGANNGVLQAPITGNAQTPNGGTVNASTGAFTPSTNPTGQTTSNPGLIAQAAAAANANTAIGQNSQQISQQYGQNIAQIASQAAGQEGQYLTGGGLMPTAMGRAQTIGQTAGALESAQAAGESAALQGNTQALTAQQQASQGLLGAAGLTQPQSQFGVLTNPQTGQPVSGTLGTASNAAASGGVIQANQNSAMSLQSSINTIGSTLQAAQNNFSILQSYASQGGTPTNSPILNQLAQLYGTTVGDTSNPAIAGFLAQLGNVRQAYTAITGNSDATTAIPNNITPAGLQQVEQTLTSTAQNNVTNYQSQLQKLTGQGSSSTTGGTIPMFRNFNG